ncbi:hypothetical protein TNCV_272361 [Trichonephila clavipes]|nr:hypothetical protein TNCV_272361 [Trichonephila clavipes]
MAPWPRAPVIPQLVDRKTFRDNRWVRHLSLTPADETIKPILNRKMGIYSHRNVTILIPLVFEPSRVRRPVGKKWGSLLRALTLLCGREGGVSPLQPIG